MAEYRDGGKFKLIEAEPIKGETEALYARFDGGVPDSFGRMFPPVKIQTLSILDVSGAWDGASSVATVASIHAPVRLRPAEYYTSETAENIRTIRLKETPEELIQVFKQAGLDMPPVERSFGGKMRDFLGNVFSPQHT